MIESLPRIRPDLRKTKMVQDGRTIHIVKDPSSGKYYRFGDTEMWLINRLDGTRTFETISAELKAELRAHAPPATIQQFFLKLKSLGIAERTTEEKSLMLMEVLRKDRKARLKDTSGSTIFRMRFSWGDPDQMLNKMIGPLKFFWTPAFIVLSAVVFALYVYVLVENWALFVTGFKSLYTASTYTPGFILTLYLTGVVIFVIHEFGHGLTCKYFGGEVHEMGMMLLYFSPAFYCNVNDAYTFEKRSQRLWVTFAGGWIQLFVAGLAAMLWAMTDPETTVHRIAFLATILGGGMSVLINYNPLLPLDGYYTLVDLLGITNLRPRALELVGIELKRRVLRMKAAVPVLSKREYRIMIVYGSLALLYTILVLWAVGHWAGSLVVSKFGGWGWVLIAFAVWKLTKKLRPKMARLAKSWWTEHMPTGPRRQLVGRIAIGVAAAILLAFVVPWTVRVKGSAVIEPTAKVWLRPPEPAWIDQILVHEGDKVQAGQEVMRLRSPELELELGRARARVSTWEREIGRLRAASDPSGQRLAELDLAAGRSELAALERRAALLTVRAPFAGVIATPHVSELVGSKALPGDSVIELWSVGAMRVRVALSQRDAGEVSVGDRVRVRFPADARSIWSTRVMQVGSAAHAEHLDVLAPLSIVATQHALHPGMVGQAKVAVQRTKVARAAARSLRRLVRTEQFL